MSRGNAVVNGARVMALILVLLAMAGPWTLDSHADQEDACPAPLVYLGNGRCACKISLWTLIGVSVRWGNDPLFWLLLLPGLLLISTILLLLSGRPLFWSIHLVAWGLALALSTVAVTASWWGHGMLTLRLWGAWLCLEVAAAVLAGEVVSARRCRAREAKPA